jgi:DNA repair protein RadC
MPSRKRSPPPRNGLGDQSPPQLAWDIETSAETEMPHHYGHRDRLRTRFAQGGADALPDYELLELVLFNAIPRIDVKPLAKKLIERFKTFAGVVSAPIEQLSDAGLSDRTHERIFHELKLIEAGAQRLARQTVVNRDVIGSWGKLIDYCRIAMAHEPIEQFRVLFLDKKNNLIKDEVLQHGTIDHTPVYPREIVKRALEIGASSLILVHNHPTGDPTPSRADVEMTKEIAAAARALRISIHDHLVIGRNGHSSFRALGLL